MTMFIKKSAALVSGLAMLAGLVATQEAQAMPGFARQTGMACYSCHFQSFPTLNSFGRAFKNTGYTMVAGQNLVEGENLSLPATLNVGMITKIRYNKPEDGTTRGELQWPDEAAFLVGGRAGEKLGFLAEIALIGGHAVTSTFDPAADCKAQTDGSTVCTTSGATDTAGNFTGFKLVGNVTDNVQAILFGTDALGAGYGYETLNTGLQRAQRPIEGRKSFSAPQILGLDKAATGIALVYHTDEFAVNYSHVAPTYSNVNANIFGGLGHYIRAVYTPTLGGWDTGFGVANWSGSVETGATQAETTKVNMAATVIDAQAQGNLTDTVTLGLYASYGVLPKSTASKVNKFNNSTTKDATAAAALAKFGVGEFRPFVAYADNKKNDGTSEKVSTIGTQFELAQNIELEGFYVKSDIKTNSYWMLSMFAGF